MVKHESNRPILITDAARSQDEQLHSRQVRYVVMMSIRAGCLVVGAILVTIGAPMLWLWLSLCGAAMIVIPWLAVILANDRPPKQQHRLAHRLHRQHRDERPARSLTAEPSLHRTIDAE